MNPILGSLSSIFHSSDTGLPIQNCLVCEKFLLDGEEYIIEKSFINYPQVNTKDLVHEIAICSGCMESMMNEYSEESERRINEYYLENMDFTHQQKLKEHQMFDTEDWISRCIIKGTPIDKCSQYQICTHCVGNLCIYDRTPFMISGEAIDEMTQLISNETLGFFNDFRDQYFPPPEDLSPLFRDKDYVLI